ncbi:MAG: LuxR C-terminal-related transcriptional regulator [Ilumatobacteraceae bacterium]
MTNTPLPPCSILVRLTREWEALRRRPTAIARGVTWGLGVPIHSLDDVLVATGMAGSPADRTPVAGDTNAVLCRLVVAARHDDLAARTALQRLLPGIVAAARRRVRTSAWIVEPDRAVEELVTAAWWVIRSFPVERRSVHVAAQLLRDTEYQVYVRPLRRSLEQRPMAIEHLELALGRRALVTADADADPRDELAALVAAASLTDRDRRLLDLLTAGTPVPEVARALEVSERTVRNHRDAMISRLRQAAYTLQAA